MTKASDNAFPSLLITEGTEPAAPAAGKQRLYIDSTSHHLMRTNSSGTETDIESAAGGMASDSLWDAAGDLAVGTGANTGAKLTLGTSGYWLKSNGSTAVWASGFDPDVTMPRTITIDPRGGSKSNTNWNTITSATGEEYVLASSGAQNDEVVWDVALSAGTWSVFLVFHRYTTRGIATVYFDATNVGTIDMYGTDGPNTRGSITGISQATTALVALKLKMETKNGSSSGYGAWLALIGLIRTA